MNEILNTFQKNPLECATAIGILIIALAILLLVVALCFKIIGNPFDYLIKCIISLLPFLRKELLLQAGWVGIIDLLVTIFSFLILISILCKNNFINSLLPPDNNDFVLTLFISFLVVFLVIMSLRQLAETDKFNRLYKYNQMFPAKSEEHPESVNH